MTDPSLHLRLARRVAVAAVGLLILAVACALYYMSDLAEVAGPPGVPGLQPVQGPAGISTPSPGPAPPPAVRPLAPPASRAPEGRSAPYPPGSRLDYLDPGSAPAPRSSHAGDSDT